MSALQNVHVSYGTPCMIANDLKGQIRSVIPAQFVALLSKFVVNFFLNKYLLCCKILICFKLYNVCKYLIFLNANF